MIGVLGIDFVKCVICGFCSKKLGNHLLKEHKKTSEQYTKEYPGSVTLCDSTGANLSLAHHGRVNWVSRMKSTGQEADLATKLAEMGKKVSSTLMSNSEERRRRADVLGALNKTKEFRSKASQTALKTSSRIEILLARSERLRQWRIENPQAFYEKCTSKIVKMQSSKPEKALAAWTRQTFVEHEFRSSQKMYHGSFTTVSKQRQIDIFSKKLGIAIEFDGPIHFKNIPSWNQLEEVQKRDAEVNSVLSTEFLLIRVSYDQWHPIRGFTEGCLTQIQQEIDLHLHSPSPKLVRIGWMYHQDAEHRVASKLTMRLLGNG